MPLKPRGLFGDGVSTRNESKGGSSAAEVTA
jgi:hypothetical protein